MFGFYLFFAVVFGLIAAFYDGYTHKITENEIWTAVIPGIVFWPIVLVVIMVVLPFVSVFTGAMFLRDFNDRKKQKTCD